MHAGELSPEVAARYVEQAARSFEQLHARLGGSSRCLSLAGHSLCFAFAGVKLEPAILSAIAHLPAGSGAPSLTIMGWDGAETQAALPPPPWAWPENLPPHGIFRPCGDDSLRVFVAPWSHLILMYHAATSRAFVWTRNAAELPTYHHASPLLQVFSWWTRERDLNLVHGGCVGDDDGAVLLVGKGGSGKSTTCLLAAEAGLNYLADDYCVAASAPSPVVYSLYRSGKLHRGHLQRFPRLASLAIDPNADEFEKPMIFLGEATGHRVATQLPLRAIVVPRISGLETTSFERTSPAEALRALAPSTLLQLGERQSTALQSLADLVRAVPSYRLNLGSRFETVAPGLRELIGAAAR